MARLVFTFQSNVIDNFFIILFYFLSKAYSPVNRTGSPQGFSLVEISHKYGIISIWTTWNTIQNIKTVPIFSLLSIQSRNERKMRSENILYSFACRACLQGFYTYLDSTFPAQLHNFPQISPILNGGMCINEVMNQIFYLCWEYILVFFLCP